MKQLSKSLVVPSDAGISYWQPGVKGNCITIKISPWNIINTNHTVFLHELPKSGDVLEHAHDNNEEIFICLDGEGTITIDGINYLFKKHDVAYVAPLSKHKICNTGNVTLKFMVIISPTGLEDRLRQMGVEKKSVHEDAPDAVATTTGKTETHGVIL